MKKCLVYGNCQAMAIKSFLSKHPDFVSMYEISEVKPVHLLTQEDVLTLEKTIAEIDLFIHQPVSDDYKGIHQLSSRYIKSQLKSSCKVLSFPVAYFTGYHPEITYLKDRNKIVVSKPFPFHDLNILKLYAEGKSIDRTIEEIEGEAFYSAEYLQNNLSKTLDNLEVRESNLDVILSKFIRENFREKLLFHTFNHPSSIVLEYLLNSILDLLNIHRDKGFFELFINHDVLAQNSFPIYPSVAKYLDLYFTSSSMYRIEKQEFTRREIVESFFKFYDDNRQEVADFIAHTFAKT
jgi:Polysaccharide biosynthesis enzyme WcbI